MLAKELIDSALKSGEPLVSVCRIPLFKGWSRSTLHRMIWAGKIPVIRVGRSHYTTVRLAAEALAANSINIPANRDHAAAVESLSRKGIGTRKTAKV